MQEQENNQEMPKRRSNKLAIIKLMSDQKSKAIGKNGVNIRLASMLTEHEIEIEEIKREENPSSAPKEQKLGVDALQSLFKN